MFGDWGEQEHLESGGGGASESDTYGAWCISWLLIVGTPGSGSQEEVMIWNGSIIVYTSNTSITALVVAVLVLETPTTNY